MPISVLLFATRKPGLTPTQFAQHYEDKHMPLLQSLAGADFPMQHIRRYLAKSDDASAGFPTQALIGPPDVAYDVVAELVFRDEAHMGRFAAATGSGDAQARLQEDEEAFLDRGKLRVVLMGETKATGA